MQKVLIGLAGLIAGLILATAFGGAASAQDAVKIGIINEYSGQFADTGAQIDNGIKLYMKQHGDTVAGKKIELIRKDTGGIAPDVSKRLAQELIVRDHADILAGFSLTPNALAAADVSAEAKKLMVVMNAATAIITTKSPYIARTSSTTAQLNYTLGAWAAKNGIKTVYTMVSDYGPGIDAETWFQTGFKEGGGKVIGSVRFPVANPDFSAFVQAAKDAHPDAIYIWIPGGAQPGAVGKALAERGVDVTKTKVLGQDALGAETALKSMGNVAIGIITVADYDFNHNSPLNHEFVKAFNDEFHRNPDFFAVGGYDGMHLIYEALKKTGGKADGDSLIAAAKGMSWESPRGPISIDPETRDIVQTVYIRRVEKVGDELRNVEFDSFPKVKDPFKARMAH
ncbi:MAG TPA: ABC transporter substrate-binding protein [Xanthobacteraceae bacterium]|nr:ABC transporter substrate-binding protein [Xanthobacteraceae bacterium]